MAKPKPTVLFIVEGGSDETALKRILKKLYKKKEINFEVTDGDITSDESVNVQNVEEKIFKIVALLQVFCLEEKLYDVHVCLPDPLDPSFRIVLPNCELVDRNNHI